MHSQYAQTCPHKCNLGGYVVIEMGLSKCIAILGTHVQKKNPQK